MNDPLHQQLEALVAPIDDHEVDAALRQITRRARRARRALAVAGVAAVSSSLVGAVAVLRAGDGAPDAVSAGGEAEWPWTTSTTAVTFSLGEIEYERVKDEVWARLNQPDARPYLKECCYDKGVYDVVDVALRADAIPLAQEVWERWGSAVRIRVGERIYPTGEPSEEIPACQAIEVGDGIPGLEARLELADDGVVRSGADVVGTLVLHNSTGEIIEVPYVKAGDVVMPGGRDQVGGYEGVFTTEYRTIEVAPGATEEIPDIAFGTTACGPDGPPGLAPGEYEAMALVTVELPRGEHVEPHFPPPMAVRAPLTVVD